VVKKQVKFGVGISVIIVSLAFLAWLGYGESKTYYHTIQELQTLRGSQLAHRMRVGGTVSPGSIRRFSGRVDFILEGEGKTLPVSYIGSDPLPDTFVDKSQALVEGRPATDGRFVAERVQAKCASKYEAAPGGGSTPSTQQSGM
jgi:cytochrome c-type biogenesis protein CcmE